MKKIITILIFTFVIALVASAQNPFIKDGSNIVLKVPTDKIGVGITPTADKFTVYSLAGETPLGIIGYPNHYNPYITLYNSNKVAVWKLFANPDWFTIGDQRDTTLALIVGKINKNWFKVNGTGSFTALRSALGTITTIVSTTATITTIGSTTGNITTINSTTANLAHIVSTDTTGIVLYNRAGTRYRLYISSNGTVKVSTVP